MTHLPCTTFPIHSTRFLLRIIACIDDFGINELVKKAKNAKKNREANKQANLERKIREEYESEPVEEEEYVYDSEGSEQLQ